MDRRLDGWSSTIGTPPKGSGEYGDSSVHKVVVLVSRFAIRLILRIALWRKQFIHAPRSGVDAGSDKPKKRTIVTK